jgi:hypothetical protein
VEFLNNDAELAGLPPISRIAGRMQLVDQAIFWVFVGGLAWVPLWYGSNTPIAWGINAALFPALTVIYEISRVLPGQRHPVALRRLAAPAGAFVGVVLWVALQTATWMPAPFANPIWGMAAEVLGRPLAASISVNRDLTELALVRLITAASVFWLAVQLCRDPMRANRLIVAVAVIGFIYAAYGLVALNTGPVAWLDIPAIDGRVTSTFVNHNTYATFAGIGLIATVGLLVRLYQRGAVEGGSWRLRFATLIEATGGHGAALIASGFVTLAALLLTGSRGGVLSTGAGLAMLGGLALWRARHRERRPAAAVIVPLGLVTATLLVFGSLFADNLGERGVADSNRMAVFLLTLRSILDAPLFGLGDGTFSDVFPMYRDRSLSIEGIWAQAHDTYLEALQGLGLVFGLMLIAALALLAVRCVRGAVQRQENATVPRVAAGVACLVGVHSVVDFSLQIQAVALTFMAVLGAGVAQATSSRIETGD